MTPTARAAGALAVIAVAALFVPAVATLVLVVIAVAAVAVDAVITRRRIRVRRTLPRVIARGVPARLVVEHDLPVDAQVEIRQAQPPDVTVTPSTGHRVLEAQVVAHRRGVMELPPVAARRTGPLGFARTTFEGAGTADLLVYPDVFAAHRMVAALRQGRFRDPGLRTRGPLGLGTEFESIRDYQPDDDIRQINWTATARTGRPMSNIYRVEQDRDVICMLDAGRLMFAPIDGRTTRLDVCVDAITMVALVADELGDRCGVTVFDEEIRRQLSPRRNGGRSVVGTVVDVEPRPVESDHDLAFRSVGRAKRALVIVFTDLLDEAAARSLTDAVPLLARRHAVVVASVRDPDVEAAVNRPLTNPSGLYGSAVAIDALEARTRVTARLRHSGAEVVDAPASRLGDACVGAYLRLKARARL